MFHLQPSSRQLFHLIHYPIPSLHTNRQWFFTFAKGLSIVAKTQHPLAYGLWPILLTFMFTPTSWQGPRASVASVPNFTPKKTRNSFLPNKFSPPPIPAHMKTTTNTALRPTSTTHSFRQVSRSLFASSAPRLQSAASARHLSVPDVPGAPRSRRSTGPKVPHDAGVRGSCQL